MTKEFKDMEDFIREDMEPFGPLVRKWRRARNFTQVDLSSRSGISRATIAGIETGCSKSDPELGTIIALLRACGQKLVPCVEEAEAPKHTPRPRGRKIAP